MKNTPTVDALKGECMLIQVYKNAALEEMVDAFAEACSLPRVVVEKFAEVIYKSGYQDATCDGLISKLSNL